MAEREEFDYRRKALSTRSTCSTIVSAVSLRRGGFATSLSR
jgi:hypothetical protein